ncbi:MAG: hypothetical protein RJB66_2362 [Pseudomonadota bacterium]|jgi:hypothetical protein
MKSKWLVFVGIGFEAVGIVLASIWLGQYLDEHFQSKGLFTILLTFTGLGGWFARIFFLLKRMSKM